MYVLYSNNPKLGVNLFEYMCSFTKMSATMKHFFLLSFVFVWGFVFVLIFILSY